MESNFKKITQMHTFALIILTFFVFSYQSNAQTKPAGKTWPTPDEYIKMKNPVVSNETILADGKELYNQHCKSCHGVKGKGDGEKSAKIEILCGDFTSPQFLKAPDGEVYYKTTEGRKPMPAYNEKLTDLERWTVITYVRSLGKK